MSLGEGFALAAAISWATAAILYRKASLNCQSGLVVSITTTIAFVLFFVVCLLERIPLVPPLDQSDWIKLIVSGILGITIGDFFVVIAIRMLGAGLEAIVSCIYAPAIMLLAFLFFRETVPPVALLGTGLIIVAILLGSGDRLHFRVSKRAIWIGIALGLLSQIFMGASILMVRDIYREISVIWVAGFRFMIGSVTLIVLTAMRTSKQDLRKAFRPKTLKYVLPAGFFGPFLATTLWILGFKYALAGKAAVFNQLSTIFIFILAGLFLSEPMTRRRIAAVCLAFLGALIASQG